MSKAKPHFTIPNSSTITPREGGPSFVPGDEDQLRAALSADDIGAMIDAGHLLPREAPAEATPVAAVAAPVAAAPASSKG